MKRLVRFSMIGVTLLALCACDGKEVSEAKRLAAASKARAVTRAEIEQAGFKEIEQAVEATTFLVADLADRPLSLSTFAFLRCRNSDDSEFVECDYFED